MVSPIPKAPAQYILAYDVSPLRMLYHCNCPAYLPFLKDNLNVVQASSIPTSYFRESVPTEVTTTPNPTFPYP